MDEILESFKNGEITAEECQLRIASLQTKKPSISLKVTPKGAIGIYGIRRMPVVLYIGELVQILHYLLGEDKWEWTPETESWLALNRSNLSTK